jgi:two-component system OmpR family response regulator
VIRKMMPDGDGFEVVRQMRSSGPDIPVIFLSARDGVSERVAGLALGGDDYVTKPFSLDEVLERIRAVLRRSGRAAAATRLRVADLELDEDRHEVRRGATLIALTATEFRLLRFLMLNAGRVLSRGQILDHVAGHRGLAIAAARGGEITVDTRLGQGAVFYARLPLAAGPDGGT